MPTLLPDPAATPPPVRRRFWPAAPLWRRAGRLALLALVAGYFVFGITILVLRYAVLPHVDDYRGDLERLLGNSLGQPVSIRAVDADWQGFRPRLALHGLSILDAAGRPALSFDTVRAVVSWSSLPRLALRLERLEIESPTLAMARDAEGHFYIAGMRINTDAERGDLGDWILGQRKIVVRNATLSWLDQKRGSPLLELKGVNLQLESFGSRHRFGLQARAPQVLAGRVDLRGEFRGHSLDRLGQWKGEAYGELRDADLGRLRPWLDAPLETPQGKGALRLWLEVADGALRSATADLALRGVRLRLQQDLPPLDLASLRGRVFADRPAGRLTIGANDLELEARDGLRFAPSSFTARLAPEEGSRPAAGEIGATLVDLAAWARLADHLPLEPVQRRQLAAYAPRGILRDLKLRWSGPHDAPDSYGLEAHFSDLGASAQGEIPGFAGLSGSISADQRGGKLLLNARRAALFLPKVFAEPRVDFERLDVDGTWTVANGAVDFRLRNAAFASKDAEGTATGRYKSLAGGPGEIDLTAALTRGAATAVWRYIPLSVGGDVREWLKRSLIGGQAYQAKLQLKGDLANFPFADPRQGIFQVAGRFGGATLRYAPDWPDITAIDGSLLFEGKRMTIKAEKGAVYGTRIAETVAEIADLGAADPLLTVKGGASGPTKDFLRFIATSPVAEAIGHFTDGMAASGDGSLKLALAIPLNHPDRTGVRGSFDLVNNTLAPDPGLPPLTAANGQIQFTQDGLSIRQAGARLFGAPLAVNAETRDGTVSLALRGRIAAADLRQHFDSPLLEHLSGATDWRGSVDVRAGKAALRIDSDLQGIASSLPEPFNKTAAEALPLHVERAALSGSRAAGRDQLRISLGRTLSVSLTRLSEGGKTLVESGAVGVNETPENPAARGVSASAKLKSLDLDSWRRLIGGGNGEPPLLPFAAVNLHAEQVTAFGQRLSGFSLLAAREGDQWNAHIASKEVTGRLEWQEQGKGRLRARLSHLALSELEPAPAATDLDRGRDDGDLKELPGLDVVADAFTLRGKPLGRLELRAANRASLWHIEHLGLHNSDGVLQASGQWRAGKASGATQLDFRVDAKDVGKLLERLGYGNAVKRGSAVLEGKVAWNGAPTKIDLGSLDGRMALQAGGGQFAKLEPGVGRLLGIVSLQALPRRITLDFRDVFSEGFAFDNISGSVAMKHGTMETQDLQIQGPAARVKMVGSANLTKETQNLRVFVQPTLSESVALGAAVINPLVGIAAYVAQKALSDPIEKAFSYEYDVTGPWADPKVEKVERLARAPAPSRQ